MKIETEENRINIHTTGIMHFVGLGNAGCSIVEYFISKGLKAKFTCITRYRKLHWPSSIKFISYFSPGESVFRNGLELYRSSDFTQKPILTNELLQPFRSNDHFILIAGLGGYTGTNLIMGFSLALKSTNRDFISICSTPFRFEGEMRNIIAKRTINELKSLPNLNYFDLNLIRDNFGNLPFQVAFKKGNEEFYSIYKNRNPWV